MFNKQKLNLNVSPHVLFVTQLDPPTVACIYRFLVLNLFQDGFRKVLKRLKFESLTSSLGGFGRVFTTNSKYLIPSSKEDLFLVSEL